MNLSARMKTRGLLRDTTHLSIGQGFRLVIQAAYFVLVARSLGPDAYGAFVTVVAMAALLGPFSGLGTPNLFIKNVRSGKRVAAICWGNGILLTVLSGALLTAVAVGLSFLLHLKTAPFAVLMVCVADLVLMKVTELAAFGFAASDRMKQTSIQNVVVSLLRLAGIVALMATVHPVTLDRWVLVYLLTTLLGTIYAVAKGSQLWGRPATDLTALREDVAEGVFFSIAGSATTIYNDIDKIMLSKLADLASTGVYAAAYRVIDVSMTPIRSLAAAAYPRFFRKGMDGIGATYPYALSLMAESRGLRFGCVCRTMAVRPRLAPHSGIQVRCCRSGGALAGADSLPALPPLFPGGRAFGRGTATHAHGDPGIGGPDQHCSQPGYLASLFLARSRMDESGL